MKKQSVSIWILTLSLLGWSLSNCSILTADSGHANNPSRSTTTKEAPKPSTKEETDATTVSYKRRDVVRYAKKQLGAKYRSGGKGPNSFDCSGLTSYVMKNFGVTLSPSSRYQEKEGRKIKIKNAQPGDLIFFRRSPAGSVFHVALVVKNGRDGIEAIHSTSRGVVIDNLSKSDYWRPKMSSARDVLGDI